jgi:acyl-CoA reductase-like NAD-dependent aldehyde dehydrogenase
MPQDVDDAIAAARLAFKGWAATAMSERQKAVQKLADALFKNKNNFAEMLVKEVGKSVSPVLLKSRQQLADQRNSVLLRTGKTS